MTHSDDLFSAAPKPAPEAPRPEKAKPAPQPKKVETGEAYTAADIEVLEGLEPVRRRPGMYIGGTDEKALHHLFAEVIDNSMDEAIAGHASYIEVRLDADGYLSVTDNGRGIPVDPHPKMKDKSALEVIMTTLHAGGKFDSKVYETSGGLHGVGVSVVNALSEHLEVEVARGQQLYRQSFSRGHPISGLESLGAVRNRRGTTVRFKPDAEIFTRGATFKPERLYRMARAKAYLFGGVEIRWACDPSLLDEKGPVPQEDKFHFPNGLADFLGAEIKGAHRVADEMFTGVSGTKGRHGTVEWAIVWTANDASLSSYCNTVTTPDGGTHESGFRTAMLRGIKSYADLVNNKRASIITAEDVMANAQAMLSVFVREPEFQGQTKDRLATLEAARIVENAVRDAFDHWMAASPNQANKLLDWIIERAEERVRRRKEKDISRKNAVRKLRLPGKLADCSNQSAAGTELFIVEGDSAGGSAKQARNRATQAILPLRGKILNVESATRDKFAANQQLGDILQALGCGTGKNYREEDLRYERVIIMTDADVDGAHIAALLMTFFFRELPELVRQGHLFLAVPPLYRLTAGSKTLYARDDAHKDELLATVLKGRKVEVGRFKGLGEMMAHQLKETTMDPSKRTLLQVQIPEDGWPDTREAVSALMGNKAELRFAFIQDRAAFATNLDI